ncbi:MAG: antitoxin VapB family protein [Nanoarchaeota archaeon]
MAITTIQLDEKVKNRLNRMKGDRETYEEVIVKLIDKEKTDKEKMEELLRAEAEEMAEESLKIAKEWEGTLMDGLDKNEKWEF